MSVTKVGPKHQVTIPKEVFERLKLEIGDYLDVRIKGTTITMVPAKFPRTKRGSIRRNGSRRSGRRMKI